jgi:hypothetical protein
MENQIRVLLDKYRPTKYRHNYEGAYWRFFKDIQFTAKSVLEIGVESGKSLYMWREFFPNARIFGIDINLDCLKLEDQDNRLCVKVGDQSDPEFLKQISQMAGGFDVVIDDGSHIPEHQIITFETLFPLMRSPGIYVVEDMEQRWAGVDYFAGLTRHLNYYEPVPAWHHSSYFKGGDCFDNNIIGLYFGRYICFVMKGHNPDNPYLYIGS